MIPTYPDGIDVEVFKFKVLENAYHNATLKSDREHVTSYIWRNSSVMGGRLFKSFNIKNGEDISDIRITVDNKADFILIRILIESLGYEKSWKEYVDYLRANPEVMKINSVVCFK